MVLYYVNLMAYEAIHKKPIFLFHFVSQWECQTLVNQSFLMMHLSGKVMDIDIMSLENSPSLFRFCRF